jgi:hypothetical protein
MHLIRPLARIALASLTLSLAAGCAVEPDDIDTGVSIPLTTTTPNGTTYRLSNATFNFTGPEARSVTSSGDETALDVALSPGSYLLELAAGWRMERLQNGVPQPVDAALVSQAVQQVTVLPGSVSQAYYQFLLAAEGGSGSVTISFGVTEAATLTGTLSVADPTCDPTTGCAPTISLVTQIAFPPLAPESIATDALELHLTGGGTVFDFFDDSLASAAEQLAGSPISMILRRGRTDLPDQPQQLSIDIGSDTAPLRFAIGPAQVVNSIRPDGFPAVPTELTFEAPLVVRNLTGGQTVEAQGTASLTYHSPIACTPNGSGCGTP